LPRADVVVTMTDPPLLLLLGVILKWTRKTRLVHWAQDLYPEVAEELGVLSKGGKLASLCRRCSTWGLRQHQSIIAIGRCMKKRLVQRGLPMDLIHIIPNWTPAAQPIDHPANPWRRDNRLEGRFVVMYSGNFGLAHSFAAVIVAAAQLGVLRPEILFLFVGAGPRLAWVKQHVETLKLGNVRFLPPQPLERLAQTLSAADLHLVSMRQNLCGLVVPSKVYGALAAGRACVFLGPKESEAARIIEQYQCGSVIDSCDGNGLARCLAAWAANPGRLRSGGENARQAAEHFTLSGAAESFREILCQTACSNAFVEREIVPQQIPNKTQT